MCDDATATVTEKSNTKIGFKAVYRLMQVKSITECSYFRPSLSYHLPLRPLFCPFLSGRLGQVLLLLYLIIAYALCTLNVYVQLSCAI